MSNAAANKREATIAMTENERAERLLDFRINTVADVLTEPPYMYKIERLGKALDEKRKAALDALKLPEGEPELLEKETRRIGNTVFLTSEEVKELQEPFPGFPETTPETLVKEAYDFFNQEDDRGRKPYQLLIEEVISEFWVWATPRPTISVSAFMQGK